MKTHRIKTALLLANFIIVYYLICFRKANKNIKWFGIRVKKHRSNNAFKRCFSNYGGERGIRTLETLLTFTRVPVVRLRPAQPSLRGYLILYQNFLQIASIIFAELKDLYKLFLCIAVLYKLHLSPRANFYLVWAKCRFGIFLSKSVDNAENMWYILSVK